MENTSKILKNTSRITQLIMNIIFQITNTYGKIYFKVKLQQCKIKFAKAETEQLSYT